MKVQTIKEKSPAKNPIRLAYLTSMNRPVTMTGIMARVITIGPSAGKEPNGVKQKI